MNRTDRLHAITRSLRTAGRRGRTASWLADAFEVSARTIKRDVAALVEIGVPVVAQDGRGGGYQLLDQQAVAPVGFSASEATAVAVALASDPGLPFGSDGAAALDKVLGAMTKAQREAASSLAARLWMRQPTERPRSKAARLVEEALRERVVVMIDYEDGHGRRSRRRPIEPMALARTKEHWHVLAWCQQRRAGRWFRLDRVKRAWPTRQAIEDRDLAEVFGPAPDDAQPVQLPR